MKYRAEIDGLRALAVLPVIFFHAGFEWFSGGFIGVDIFFVISGYLITTIIIEEIENKKFSIVNFYERRARRILPALFTVLILSTISAWVLLSDTSLNKYGNALIGVTLFLSNFVFWREQGYFDESAELNPLLHTWSLAVEEQYYLLFPIFLLLVWRFGKEKVFWMIVAMAAISMLISEWGWRNTPTANFYLAHSRAWELFAGSIAAFIIQKRGVQKNEVLSLLGISAVVFSMFTYDNSTPFPSFYTLLPVIGVALLILFADKETLVARMLSNKLIVGIGLISYSAYLWHVPLFAYTRIITNEIELENGLSLILIALTFIGAFVSWRYIEKPFRDKSFLSRRMLFLLSLVVMLILLLVGYSSKIAVKGSEYKLARELSQNKFVYFENMDERKFVEGRLMYELNNVNHVIVGSSRIMQINSEIIGEPILNLSVSGATIEDDVAFLLESVAKLSPTHVYIAADPWLLNKYDYEDRYKSINELYKYWLERISGNLSLTPYLDEFSDMQNRNFFSNSVSHLRNNVRYQNLSIPKDGEYEAVAKKAYDGYHIYNEAYVNNGDFKSKFPGLLNYAMKDFAYDVEAEKILDSLIAYLISNGLNVTLVLPPYHPEVYELMKSQKPIFIEIEKKFRSIARDKDIAIIGSYNSSRIGCLVDEFYDGMHPKHECMSKVFSKPH